MRASWRTASAYKLEIVFVVAGPLLLPSAVSDGSGGVGGASVRERKPTRVSVHIHQAACEEGSVMGLRRT